jgi:hypothetical protein
VTVSPFVKDQQKYVILLTYPNAGSTLVGQLFNTNRKAFYAIQPLDSLYSALYGTIPGWNNPLDIFTLSNGTNRLHFDTNMNHCRLLNGLDSRRKMFSCDLVIYEMVSDPITLSAFLFHF